MRRLFQILNHRDFILTLALATGLVIGEHSRFLAEISVYTLGVVMIFATSGFSFGNWWPLKKILAPLGWSVLLNYVIFGLTLVLSGWLVFSSEPYLPYFIGIVLLAAAPPGPSVIPFSAMLQGDDHFAVTGVFALHLLALVLAPLILFLVLGIKLINPIEFFEIMVKLVLIPLAISRVLRHPKLLEPVSRMRDSIIKWGFFLVIVPITGMSAGVFFSEPIPLLGITAILMFAMFAIGFGYHTLMRKLGYPRPFLVSSTLMLATKSSAFAAVAAFTFFEDIPEVALPAAVTSVLVTLYVIVYSRFLKITGA